MMERGVVVRVEVIGRQRVKEPKERPRHIMRLVGLKVYAEQDYYLRSLGEDSSTLAHLSTQGSADQMHCQHSDDMHTTCI